MKKISRRSFLLACGGLAAAALAGCSSTAPDPSAAQSTGTAAPSVHAPITILTASRDYSDFLKLLHASYPEINVQFIAYRGRTPPPT